MSERVVSFHVFALGLSGSEHAINVSTAVRTEEGRNRRPYNQASSAQVAPYFQWNQFTLTFAFTGSLTITDQKKL
jgi:hypothetical protein